MSASHPPATATDWQIKLLYDGECPLCLREVRFLQHRDAGRGRIAFVDIAAPDYDPDAHSGIDFATAMGRIHAIRADGTILRDLDVFRQVYDVLGIGWIYAMTKWPVVGAIANRLYDFWAERRLAFTGRPDLDAILAARQAEMKTTPAGRCRLPSR